MGERPEFVTVGRIVRVHGVHGRLIVMPLTDHRSRFEPGASFLVGPEHRVLTVRSTSPYKGKLLVAFEEITDRPQAEELRRVDLMIKIDELGAPPEGGLWFYEIEGREVIDGSGRKLGRVVGLQANPAHDLLVAEDDRGREFLVPMVAALMEPLEPDTDHVVVHPLPGLLPEDTGPG